MQRGYVCDRGGRRSRLPVYHRCVYDDAAAAAAADSVLHAARARSAPGRRLRAAGVSIGQSAVQRAAAAAAPASELP